MPFHIGAVFVRMGRNPCLSHAAHGTSINPQINAIMSLFITAPLRRTATRRKATPHGQEKSPIAPKILRCNQDNFIWSYLKFKVIEKPASVKRRACCHEIDPFPRSRPRRIIVSDRLSGRVRMKGGLGLPHYTGYAATQAFWLIFLMHTHPLPSP